MLLQIPTVLVKHSDSEIPQWIIFKELVNTARIAIWSVIQLRINRTGTWSWQLKELIFSWLRQIHPPSKVTEPLYLSEDMNSNVKICSHIFLDIFFFNGRPIKGQHCTHWSYFPMNPLVFLVHHFLGYILRSAVLSMTFFSEEKLSRYNMNNLLWSNQLRQKGQNVE